MKVSAFLISIAVPIASTIGCSAFFESAGIPPTDLSNLYLGMSRDDAEKILGPPKSESAASMNGFSIEYIFDRGYRPAGDWKVTRSIAYETADVVTFGSYSLSTLEAQKAILRVLYDREGRIVEATEIMLEHCSNRAGEWPREMCEKVQQNLYPSTLPPTLTSRELETH